MTVESLPIARSRRQHYSPEFKHRVAEACIAGAAATMALELIANLTATVAATFMVKVEPL